MTAKEKTLVTFRVDKKLYERYKRALASEAKRRNTTQDLTWHMLDVIEKAEVEGRLSNDD